MESVSEVTKDNISTPPVQTEDVQRATQIPFDRFSYSGLLIQTLDEDYEPVVKPSDKPRAFVPGNMDYSAAAMANFPQLRQFDNVRLGMQLLSSIDTGRKSKVYNIPNVMDRSVLELPMVHPDYNPSMKGFIKAQKRSKLVNQYLSTPFTNPITNALKAGKLRRSDIARATAPANLSGNLFGAMDALIPQAGKETKQIKELKKEVASLRSELAKLSNMSPTIGGNKLAHEIEVVSHNLLFMETRLAEAIEKNKVYTEQVRNVPHQEYGGDFWKKREPKKPRKASEPKLPDILKGDEFNKLFDSLFGSSLYLGGLDKDTLKQALSYGITSNVLNQKDGKKKLKGLSASDLLPQLDQLMSNVNLLGQSISKVSGRQNVDVLTILNTYFGESVKQVANEFTASFAPLLAEIKGITEEFAGIRPDLINKLKVPSSAQFTQATEAFSWTSDSTREMSRGSYAEAIGNINPSTMEQIVQEIPQHLIDAVIRQMNDDIKNGIKTPEKDELQKKVDAINFDNTKSIYQKRDEIAALHAQQAIDVYSNALINPNKSTVNYVPKASEIVEKTPKEIQALRYGPEYSAKKKFDSLSVSEMMSGGGVNYAPDLGLYPMQTYLDVAEIRKKQEVLNEASSALSKLVTRLKGRSNSFAPNVESFGPADEYARPDNEEEELNAIDDMIRKV